MTKVQNSTRIPKEGDYAILDTPGGRLVICNRQFFPGNRFCRQAVAEIELLYDEARQERRLLRLWGTSWRETGGIWRLAPADQKRVWQGLEPRGSPVAGPFRIWTPDPDAPLPDIAFATVWYPNLPARLECPRCGHRRILDAVRLAVEPVGMMDR